MAVVRVWNPSNPRKKKPLTREQVEKRQAKAVKFAADVLEDDALADELESLTPREYADRKGLRMTNPTRNRKDPSMKRDELKQVVKDAVSEAINQTRRSNPNGQSAAPSAVSAEPKVKSKSRQFFDRVDDAAAALADGDEDEALDILNGVLDDYDQEKQSR